MDNFSDTDKFTFQLNLPPATLKVIKKNSKFQVFDPLRKKYVCLTNEEYVRQSLVSWLINHLEYPSSLMANEKGVKLNNTYKRCDTVVFSPMGKPLMILEYKAPNVKITQDVFNQIVRYFIVLKAPYLVVSNGIEHYCCKMDPYSGNYEFLNQIPSYSQIKDYLE